MHILSSYSICNSVLLFRGKFKYSKIIVKFIKITHLIYRQYFKNEYKKSTHKLTKNKMVMCFMYCEKVKIEYFSKIVTQQSFYYSYRRCS